MPCVFEIPIHPSGGCIFADPHEIEVATAPAAGGGIGIGRETREYLDDDRVIMMVIRKFLEVVNGNP